MLADLDVVATGNVNCGAQEAPGRAIGELGMSWCCGGTIWWGDGRLLRRYPGVLERTVELGRACAFDFTVIAPAADFQSRTGIPKLLAA